MGERPCATRLTKDVGFGVGCIKRQDHLAWADEITHNEIGALSQAAMLVKARSLAGKNSKTLLGPKATTKYGDSRNVGLATISALQDR